MEQIKDLAGQSVKAATGNNSSDELAKRKLQLLSTVVQLIDTVVAQKEEDKKKEQQSPIPEKKESPIDIKDKEIILPSNDNEIKLGDNIKKELSDMSLTDIIEAIKDSYDCEEVKNGRENYFGLFNLKLVINNNVKGNINIKEDKALFRINDIKLNASAANNIPFLNGNCNGDVEIEKFMAVIQNYLTEQNIGPKNIPKVKKEEEKKEVPAAEVKKEVPVAKIKKEEVPAAEVKKEVPAAEVKKEVPAAEVKKEVPSKVETNQVLKEAKEDDFVLVQVELQNQVKFETRECSLYNDKYYFNLTTMLNTNIQRRLHGSGLSDNDIKKVALILGNEEVWNEVPKIKEVTVYLNKGKAYKSIEDASKEINSISFTY